MTSARRILKVVVLVAVTIVVLTGCQAVSRVSTELRRRNLIFAYCDTYSATAISVDLIKKREGSNVFTEVWATRGQPPLRKGQLVKYGVAPFGFTNSRATPIDPAKTTIEVAFKDLDHESQAPYLVINVDGSKLVEGKWLNWKGQIVSTPCGN
jgi:hypothetical protein